MSELKNKKIEWMDGKPYLKCRVELIPTEDRNAPIHAEIYSKKDKLKLSTIVPDDKLDIIIQHYHLVILDSNREYKKGDLIFSNERMLEWGKVYEATCNYHPNYTFFCPTVISSTNKYLELPLPSQSFIEKYVEMYNKDKQIGEVMVELNTQPLPEDELQLDFCLKVDKYYTITTRKIKDSWTDEEVDVLLQRTFTEGYASGYVDGLKAKKLKQHLNN